MSDKSESQSSEGPRTPGFASRNMSFRNLEGGRKNPLVFFQTLTNRPEALMLNMQDCGVLLSGSRALDYFVQEPWATESSWDFFCPGWKAPFATFMDALTDIGTIWSNVDGSESGIYDTMPYPGNEDKDIQPKLIVLSGRLTYRRLVHRIQLISMPNASALELVFRSYSTVVQNYISGYHAVSLYHVHTENRNLVYWPGCDNATQSMDNLVEHFDSCAAFDGVRSTCVTRTDKVSEVQACLLSLDIKQITAASTAIHKYIDRGYTVFPAESLILSRYQNKRYAAHLGGAFGESRCIPRYLGDKYTAFEDFAQYMPYGPQMLPRACREISCESCDSCYISRRSAVALRMAHQVTWWETNLRCVYEDKYLNHIDDSPRIPFRTYSKHPTVYRYDGEMYCSRMAQRTVTHRFPDLGSTYMPYMPY